MSGVRAMLSSKHFSSSLTRLAVVTMALAGLKLASVINTPWWVVAIPFAVLAVLAVSAIIYVGMALHAARGDD